MNIIVKINQNTEYFKLKENSDKAKNIEENKK